MKIPSHFVSGNRRFARGGVTVTPESFAIGGNKESEPASRLLKNTRVPRLIVLLLSSVSSISARVGETKILYAGIQNVIIERVQKVFSRIFSGAHRPYDAGRSDKILAKINSLFCSAILPNMKARRACTCESLVKGQVAKISHTAKVKNEIAALSDVSETRNSKGYINIARHSPLLGVGTLALVLGGCSFKGPASVQGGECRIFARPEYAVAGRTSYDQDWIDGNVEAGVGGCGWKRPAARPPELDAKPKAAKPTVHKAKKKPSFLSRVRARVTGKPVEPVPYIVATPPIVAEPKPEPAPRDPVYEFLGVEGK
jgi:hypothetical protein